MSLKKLINSISDAKVLYLWNSQVIDDKCKEVQINWNPRVLKKLTFNVDMSGTYNIFLIDIDIFNLFTVEISKNEKMDHAGFTFNFSLIGFEFYYNNYDTRHWDWENEDWCKYD